MKQIKTKSGEILIAEVPEDIDLDTLSYSTSQDLHLLTATGKDVDIYCNNIPDIKLIGILSELTDEQCEEFVEFNFPFDGQSIKIYKNYYYVPLEPWDTNPWYKSAKESFISLLQSEGIDTSKELLIIKIL